MHNTKDESFSFWLPLQEIKKSGTAKKDEKRWIQGIASTESTDLQGEIVKQHGIDFSYFIKSGFFNLDHKPGVENKVGEPTECKVTKDGLWVKGFIYEGKKAADDIWEHIHSLNKSGAKRRLGFSIEGKVTKRSGNVIEKCHIMDIAITPAPVNATTWAELAKSLSAQKWDFNKSISYNELTFEETVQYVKTNEGVDQDDAETIAALIFENL